MFFRCVFISVIVSFSAFAQTELEILSASLDPAECYHVREVEIHQGDATFYLTEGYLIFGKAVNGAPVNAVFTTDVEGGDAEIVMIPPDRAERKTLGAFTGSPNLDEHFTQAVFFFTDAAARSVAESIRHNPGADKVPAEGLLLVQRYGLTVTNMLATFSTRILLDLMTEGGGAGGFFDATVRGRKLGDFDVVHDARASEQIAVGKLVMRDDVPTWDTWTRFVDIAHKDLPAPAPEEEILGYKIEASLDASLAMHCVTRIHVRTTADSRNVLPFELASEMRVVSAKVDGAAAEIHQRPSRREGLVQNSGNELILVVPRQPLTPGEHEVEIEHEGKVVQDAGNGIYSVSARGTWYPGRDLQFATYDVTWKYPDNLDLISAGAVTEDHAAGGIRTTHRVPAGRLRLLGFNLGKYAHAEVAKNGISLSVSANREFEAALRAAMPAPAPVVVPDPSARSHAMRVPQVLQGMALPSGPADRVNAIAAEMLGAIQFFQARFGEPPLKHIEVSPVTGRYGQGFAGMIYLPTLMYVDPANIPVPAGSRIDDAFMGQLLRVHETAHQWWGNVVATDSYHHEWLMESLANYSALMYLESTMGPGAVEKGLAVYRDELLMKGPDGATAESRGPVVEGRRLESGQQPRAATAVLYGKGTWIIHMLRRRMGDAGFLKMLAELRRRYEWKAITTEEFRLLCAEFVPAGAGDKSLVEFFDQWVYDTGMPALKLSYTVAGGRLTGTVTQSDVGEEFSVAVPVEVRLANGKRVVKVVRPGVKFVVDGVGAVMDPGWSVLRR